jgi:uncharacterized protein
MHFEHQITAAAPIDKVWDFLWQVERVGACLPGCQKVETVEPFNRYMATIEERIGPFRARLDWDINVEERDPQRAIRLSANGRDAKLGATARAALAIRLEAANGGRTTVEIDTELTVTGKIATLGQTVIRRKSDDVVKQFTQNLQAQLDSGV